MTETGPDRVLVDAELRAIEFKYGYDASEKDVLIDRAIAQAQHQVDQADKAGVVAEAYREGYSNGFKLGLQDLAEAVKAEREQHIDEAVAQAMKKAILEKLA